MSNVGVCDDNDNKGDVKEGSIMSETAKCGVCGAVKFGREAVAAAGGAEGDAFRSKLAEYDARVLKGRVGSVEFERPMLGLKPRRVAEDERLAEVLDAMARYVRAGKAVPGEWREELEELLAWRDSRFSKQAKSDDIAAALARDRQAADVTEHLGAEAVRRALGEGAAEETRRDRGVFIDTSDLIDEDKMTLERVMESADRSGAMVADLIFHYLGEYFKLRPWEIYPEPAKPNIPQSEAESSKPTSTGLLVGPAGCGTCVSGWDEGISSGMVLCARRSVRNGRFYICGDYNRMSYAELDERMDRKFCGEQVKPNAPRTEADCT